MAAVARVHHAPNTLSVAERQALVVSALPGVRRLVYKLVGPRGPRAVGDAMGDAHLVLCRIVERFDPAGPAEFTTFALGYLKKRVGRNFGRLTTDAFTRAGLSCDFDRLAGVRHPDPADAGDDDAPPADPDDARERAEVAADVGVLFAGASGTTLDLVRAVAVDGRTVDQVAAERGVHPKMLALQLRGALRGLAEAGAVPARLLAACGVAPPAAATPPPDPAAVYARLDAGDTLDEVRAAFGLSAAAAKRYRERWLARRAWRSSRVRAWGLLAAGASNRELAGALGITIGAATDRRREWKRVLAGKPRRESPRRTPTPSPALTGA